MENKNWTKTNLEPQHNNIIVFDWKVQGLHCIRKQIFNEFCVYFLGVKPDVMLYNALLSVYVQNNHDFNPLEILEKMENNSIEPNRVRVSVASGNSRKYPYPTTDGFHILNPPPPCLQNSKLVNPPPSPSEFPFFHQALWNYLLDSVQHFHDQTNRNLEYMLSPLLLNILLIKMRANGLFWLLSDCCACELSL